MYVARLFSLLLMLMIAAAAFGQMTVISSSPANGAVNVPLSSTVSFTFSEPLDTSLHFGEEGLCIVFLSHDPQDSAQMNGYTFSADLRTMYFDLTHTPNTDFVDLILLARSQSGDTLAEPYGLCYTTANAHGIAGVHGTVSVENGTFPPRVVVGLMDQAPFGQGHATLAAGGTTNDPNGGYVVPFVRPGVYYPIAACDVDRDGTMDSEADLIGFYDPQNTGQPQTISVSTQDLGNINMVMRQMNGWSTARARVQAAINAAAGQGSDYRMVGIFSLDTVTVDGRDRIWTYLFQSALQNRIIAIMCASAFVEVDTSWNQEFPPNVRTVPENFLDSDSAMAIAESHGGSWFGQNFDVTGRTLYGGNLYWVFPQDTTAIFWLAGYGSSGQEHLEVVMDMVSGNILWTSAADDHNKPISPESFGLMQNYPNPFNPETNIPFTVPQTARVSLKVYNLEGQEVMTLVDRTVEPGLHMARFNAASLPSGLYFYRLQAGRESFTKKMLLVK